MTPSAIQEGGRYGGGGSPALTLSLSSRTALYGGGATFPSKNPETVCRAPWITTCPLWLRWWWCLLVLYLRFCVLICILVGALVTIEFLWRFESVVCRTMLKTTSTTRNMHVHTVATTTKVYGRCSLRGSDLLSEGFIVTFIFTTGTDFPKRPCCEKKKIKTHVR